MIRKTVPEKLPTPRTIHRTPQCAVPRHAGVQKRTDQVQHSNIANSTRNPTHQGVVIDSIRELFQFEIHHPTQVLGDEALGHCDRLMSRPPSSETVAASRNL